MGSGAGGSGESCSGVRMAVTPLGSVLIDVGKGGHPGDIRPVPVHNVFQAITYNSFAGPNLFGEGGDDTVITGPTTTIRLRGGWGGTGGGSGANHGSMGGGVSAGQTGQNPGQLGSTAPINFSDAPLDGFFALRKCCGRFWPGSGGGTGNNALTPGSGGNGAPLGPWAGGAKGVNHSGANAGGGGAASNYGPGGDGGGNDSSGPFVSSHGAGGGGAGGNTEVRPGVITLGNEGARGGHGYVLLSWFE